MCFAKKQVYRFCAYAADFQGILHSRSSIKNVYPEVKKINPALSDFTWLRVNYLKIDEMNAFISSKLIFSTWALPMRSRKT